MPRKKKVVKVDTTKTATEIVSSTFPVGTEVKINPPKVAPLGLDFGRQDLNTLVAKLNEVIEEINK